jgi:hypothetical protein
MTAPCGKFVILSDKKIRSVPSGFQKGLSVTPVFSADKFHTSTSYFAS